ncbi:PA14 domain-containing protein [Tieghemostelium lacteum]|uniref:PA14 domain-containing protein n=1 Tax=Tieghemostelium lacteum TaxID=361077 RepID=A0A151Z789_TIELA|nr:PA14 domain-containing protein [Tieghemostelium lacteum]|eukprot:KYQ89654.1 PA14 domain-containing protein [Tieghemostelium lacteum]
MKLFIITICIFSVFLNINIYNCQVAPPPTIDVSGYIYDHHPVLNPNFEVSVDTTMVPDMVLQDLNQTSRVPTWNPNQKSSYTGMIKPERFKEFFLPTGGQFNIEMPITLTLVKNSENIYSKVDPAFFPIDNKGFDTMAWSKNYKYYDDNGVPHNFHFCLKFNHLFTYRGVEEFKFTGDDDVWVFINNKLVIDLGGVHVPKSASVKLYELNGLVVNNTYNFDFFYCERHTSQSSLRIDTSIKTFCPLDFCGVCNGNGACCDAKRDCDDGNPCTIDKCPPPYSPGMTKDNFKCTHEPMKCPGNSSICATGFCDNGQCKTSLCESNDFCTKSICNPNAGGCYTEPRCKGDKCNTPLCNGQDKTCSLVPIQCDSSKCPDKCMDYTCDLSTGGWVGTPTKKCQSSNVCKPSFCNPTSGLCEEKPVVNCTCNCEKKKCKDSICNQETGQCSWVDTDVSDGIECTDDSCDLNTGLPVHTPKDCLKFGECSSCKVGICGQDDMLCNDYNLCTLDVCNPNLTCSHTKISCDDGNPCTVDSCNATSGCVHEPVVCPDLGGCQVGVCRIDRGGCVLEPRQCPIPADFCRTTVCTEPIGCVEFDRECVPENPRCQKGICNNETRECTSKDYDPAPFICSTAKVVSTSVIAGVSVAGAVALGLAIFGGKKGYDHWKETRGNTISMASSNPLYEANTSTNGENPLYNNNTAN